MTSTQPWDAGRATIEIRAIAKNPKLNLSYKLHARDRLSERGLIVSDVLHALKYGNVYQAPIPATRAGHFRYRIECKTPNGGSRSIGVVLIPAKTGSLIKVISVMWIDEFERIAGSIIGVQDDE
ncbi:DUF4258 domain-containing protein [Mesorhizobium sp. M1060]|uniref:DUF4258 domain-containing protein n=1 Tax=unclassified Mesorhizobium TaxID=325217 RepID=UPI0012EBE856|nr:MULTISPECIES: DUF4258 domain-containing protein [unclassified Mesorhizobium]WJI59322.1 DUF4258 domain-containing protein [Mesorhizobium sp. C432A]